MSYFSIPTLRAYKNGTIQSSTGGGGGSGGSTLLLHFDGQNGTQLWTDDNG